MDTFFDEENIFLVIGVSKDANKYGNKVFYDLLNAGYNVIGINNSMKGEELAHTPTYESVTQFLKRVEELFDEKRHTATLPKLVAIFVIPPQIGIDVTKECLKLGVRKFWYQPGAESDEAIALCKHAGADVIHDECIMIQKP